MLEAILNRLRGTGTIIDFGTFKNVHITFNGNHVYGLYLALVFGLLAMNIWAGLAVLVAYLVGESKGWGEWVGALTRWEPKDEKWLQEQYDDEEGWGLPFIHNIANFAFKEKIEGTLEERLIQYNKYAITALAVRGMLWWGLVYGTASIFGIVSVLEAVAITVALGIGFPVACWLGKKMDFSRKYGILHLSKGWENQEIVYGLFQGIVLWAVVLLG